MKLNAVLSLMDETDCSLCLRLVICGQRDDRSYRALLYTSSECYTKRAHAFEIKLGRLRLSEVSFKPRYAQVDLVGMQKSWTYLALSTFTSQKLTKLPIGLVRGTNIVLTRLGIVRR